MANAKQISVFVDNKPNQLTGVMAAIKAKGIDLRALSLADASDYGILRFIADDTDKAAEALKSEGYAVKVTEVIAISIPDAPGQLSRVLDILGAEGVNLEYLYAFTGASDKAVSFVIRVDKNDMAAEALTKNGIILLTEKDIAEM